MDKLEILIGGFIGLIVVFCVLCLTKSADIRQQMIYEKTGIKVSWFAAVNYPEPFFTDAVVRGKGENK